MNPIGSHSTPHTLQPNIIVKPTEIPYTEPQAENSVEADKNSSHSIDAFIDKLVKRKVTIFLEREIVISALKLLQLGYKSKGLQVIALFQFDGDLYKQ